jgi:hypothetical protein
MKQCTQIPIYRYTWPGRDESYICAEHAPKLDAIAGALGMYLQLIPLTDEEQLKYSCTQQVKGE